MRIACLLTLLASTVLLTACSDLEQPDSDKSKPAKETAPATEPLEEAAPQTDGTIDPGPAELPETPADVLDPTSSNDTDSNNTNSTEEPAAEQVVAEAGVGKQGQSLEEGSLITQPAKTFFNVQQKLVFINVERALQMYKATHDSVPQSTEEFMTKIIEPNNIQLPELPRGHAYVFDAESGKLMVEKPK